MMKDESIPRLRMLQRVGFRMILPTCLILLAATSLPLSAETNEAAVVSVDSGADSSRPAEWAVKLDKPGLPNFHQVTTNLYRGAQPTAEGMAELEAMGIKSVINLRTFHSDKGELAGTGLKGIRITTQPWDGDNEEVIRFLKAISDTNNLPAFVHCQRGADRTGLMCAMYRVAICDWSKQQAIEEMEDGGFAFNPAWKNLVRYVEKADVEKLKGKAGIEAADKVQKP
jgi:protein tyrosine phosphatase (PTP) superfamily phosphohydrolase (DUF442 family)